VSTIKIAYAMLQTTTRSAAGWNPEAPGLTITSIPAKPTAMATHWRDVTCSFSTNRPRAVMRNGLAKAMATASANDRWRRDE
jgi:hypothetical protein